ncbi:hypothetical protein CC79DRAFT_1321402 [Sarocladium strictum]
MSAGNFLASITSVAAFWGGLEVQGMNSPNAVDFSSHPRVFEPPVGLRNLFPADNFNRDAATAWWQTGVLDGHPTEAASEVADAMKSASYVVLDKAMYSVVLNNSFGHRLSSPNDVVITRDGVAYITDGYYGHNNFNDTLRPEIANGVWRWEMTTDDVRQVSGAGGGPSTSPNGVALNYEEDRLFVTNRGNASDNPAGGRTIYEFNLHHHRIDKSGRRQRPVSGSEVFTYSDPGFPDGIKLDKDERMYGDVTGGVHVFNESKRQLRIIQVAEGDVAVNMQFVGSWLYIAGREHVYRVKLVTEGAQVYA